MTILVFQMTQISNMRVIGYMVHCLKIVKLWHFSTEFSFELQKLLSNQPFCGLYQGSWHVLHYTVHMTPLLLEALWRTTSSVSYRWMCISHHSLVRTRLSVIPLWQLFSCSPYKMHGKWLTMHTCHCWVNLAIFWSSQLHAFCVHDSPYVQEMLPIWIKI